MATPHKLSSEDLEEIKELWEKGWRTKAIADKYKVTPEAIRAKLKSKYGVSFKIRGVCALPECDEEFESYNPKQRCCCRKHVKKLLARESRGVVVEEAECLLPECSKQVFRVGTNYHYCSDDHRDLDWRRWNLSGFYEAILGNRKPCAVCGEKYVVEEHHIEYEGTKSNKDGPVIDLCPTHHMAIHRGFARINEAGEYESLIEVIEEGLRRKQAEKIDE